MERLSARMALLFCFLWASMTMTAGLAVAGESEMPEEPRSAAELTRPEEVIITGNRNLWALRSRMIEAEKNAYEMFNEFNDVKRFNISCSVQERTGSRFTRQVCQPEFEIAATRGHALNFLDGLTLMNPGAPPAGSISPMRTAIPMEMEILRHQAAYREKMRQVAEEHPEFLEAIIQFSELREQYEAATSSGSAE